MTAQLVISGLKEQTRIVCNQYSIISMCFVYLPLNGKKCEDKPYSTENTLHYLMFIGPCIIFIVESLALLFLYLMLNMFRMLIHPSSGACDLFVELFHGLCCSGSMCVGVTLWFG